MMILRVQLVDCRTSRAGTYPAMPFGRMGSDA